MSQIEVREVITRFRNALRDVGIPFLGMYVFGSYARGIAHRDSDIDVAVIVPSGKEVLFRTKHYRIPWMAKKIHVKLEPHLLTEQEFDNPWLTLPHEIKHHGKKIR